METLHLDLIYQVIFESWSGRRCKETSQSVIVVDQIIDELDFMVFQELAVLPIEQTQASKGPRAKIHMWDDENLQLCG